MFIIYLQSMYINKCFEVSFWNVGMEYQNLRDSKQYRLLKLK